MNAIESFRQETREWLAENCPAGARGPGQIPWGSTRVRLEDDCADVARADGGARLDRADVAAPVRRRGADAGASISCCSKSCDASTRARRLTGRGVNYIGPTLLDYGTPEQKARWLPGIARGEGGWCMGYSEPGAGSDLANLSTRAVLDGDRYIINGRKTWTSDAMESDYIFALVRTDPVAPKHDGISLMLIDMHQSGVQVRPIRLISGSSPFNETLFENAVARRDDVVGPLNQGWTVGKRLLQYERSTHAGINISGTQGRVAETPLFDIVSAYVGVRERTHRRRRSSIGADAARNESARVSTDAAARHRGNAGAGARVRFVGGEAVRRDPCEGTHRAFDRRDGIQGHRLGRRAVHR